MALRGRSWLDGVVTWVLRAGGVDVTKRAALNFDADDFVVTDDEAGDQQTVALAGGGELPAPAEGLLSCNGETSDYTTTPGNDGELLRVTLATSALGDAYAPGFIGLNSTAATGGAPLQRGPALVSGGYAWNGAASKVFDAFVQGFCADGLPALLVGVHYDDGAEIPCMYLHQLGIAFRGANASDDSVIGFSQPRTSGAGKSLTTMGQSATGSIAAGAGRVMGGSSVNASAGDAVLQGGAASGAGSNGRSLINDHAGATHVKVTAAGVTLVQLTGPGLLQIDSSEIVSPLADGSTLQRLTMVGSSKVWRGEVTTYARGVVTADIGTLSAFDGVSGGTTYDGIEFIAGDVVMLDGQSVAAENGPWVVGTVAAGVAPLTRPWDWVAGAAIPRRVIEIGPEGTLHKNKSYKPLATSGVVDTNDPLFYPRTCRGLLTLTSGTDTIDSAEGLSLATGATFDLQLRTATGTTLTTDYKAHNVTPGKVGTAAFDATACVAAGTIDTANGSQLDWCATNW